MANLNAPAMLLELMGKTNTSQRGLAEKLGCSPQLINSRLKRDTFPAEDWLTAVRVLGYDVRLVRDDGEPEPVAVRQPVCPKFKKMVDGITYDRAKATSLCHEWITGGVRELYRDDQGRYFLLTQICWPQMDATVMPCSEGEAAAFYALCSEDGDPPM